MKIYSNPVFSTFFKDTTLQKQFCSNGFIIVDLIDEAGIELLTKLYNDTCSTNAKVFESSNYGGDAERNEIINQRIIEIVTPYLDSILSQFNPVVGLFYIKPSGKKSKFYDHYDWTLVDETKHSSINIWIPLTDISSKNGNLYMYSNKDLQKLSLRGSPDLQYPPATLWRRLKDAFSKSDVYPKKGQAVIFDHRMKHGSRKNISNESRVAVGISAVPKNAQLIHYHRKRKNEVIKLAVDKEFFTTYNLQSFPKDREVLEKIRI